MFFKRKGIDAVLCEWFQDSASFLLTSFAAGSMGAALSTVLAHSNSHFPHGVERVMIDSGYIFCLRLLFGGLQASRTAAEAVSPTPNPPGLPGLATASDAEPMQF